MVPVNEPVLSVGIVNYCAKTIIEAMLVTMLSLSEDIITWVTEAMRECHHDIIDNNAKLASSIHLQIARLARMDDNLYDDKIAGEITPERYAQKHADITVEMDALEERLGKIDQLCEAA